MDKLKKVTGTWRGKYRYDPAGYGACQPVSFTLKLNQGWFGRFTGTVTDDSPGGMPDTGTIVGYFSFPKIEFTKQMPVCYVQSKDGGMIRFRDYLAQEGHPGERDFSHPPILYTGEFSTPNHAQGTWVIKQYPVMLSSGVSLGFGQATGTWTLDLAPDSPT